MLRSSFYEAEQKWSCKIREQTWVERRLCTIDKRISTLKTQSSSPSSAVQTELVALLSEQTSTVSNILTSVQASSAELQDKVSKQYEPAAIVTIKRYVPSSPITVSQWTYKSGEKVYVLELSAPLGSSYNPKKNDAFVIGGRFFLLASFTLSPPSFVVSGHVAPAVGARLTAVYLEALVPNVRLIEVEGTFQPAADGVPSIVPLFLQMADDDVEPRLSIVNKMVTTGTGDGIAIIPQVGNNIDREYDFFIESELEYSTTSLVSNKKDSYYSSL